MAFAVVVSRARSRVRATLWLLVLAVLGVVGSRRGLAAATDVAQVPLCMIGDSITWAGDGDYWRKYLLNELPALAFVGTHSAKLGYSHAGEGGNSTGRVLQRLADIPDCPYYSLEIGTNDNNVREESAVKPRAARTAARIEKIVLRLLQKPSVRKVFLGSVLPCQTKNPLRDRTNGETNVVLRRRLKSAFPPDKVVWVEYEKPIRAIANWGPMIRLHPTKEGYKLIAKILADAIARELGIRDRAAAPKPKPGSGVRVDNLWDAARQQTRIPVIAGWYTVSCELVRVAGDKPSLRIHSVGTGLKAPLDQTFPLAAGDVGKRVTVHLFTQYEGYRYTRSAMAVAPQACEIRKVLFEKRRPSGAASAYGVGSYVDTTTAAMLGELVEIPRPTEP